MGWQICGNQLIEASLRGDRSMQVEKWKEMQFTAVLLIGSSVFALIVLYFNIPSDESMVSYSWVRVKLIEDYMEIIKSGDTPNFLSAYEHSYGYAFYLPYIGVWFGLTQGWKVLLNVQLAAMFLLMVLLPFEIYLCFKNRFVALFTPILAHIFMGNVLYGFKTDSFWGMAWATVLAVPLLFYVAITAWDIKSYFIIGFIGIICSLSNVMRNHNGFFVLIMVFLILLYKVIKQKEGVLKILCAVALFFFLYMCISTIIPFLIGRILNLPTLNNGAFVWHALLAGLGYYPNSYGLEWNDAKIAEIVKTYYNYYEYATDEYALACKSLYFHICKESPGLVIKTYLKKMAEMLRYSFEFTLMPKSKSWYYWNTGRFMVHNLTIPVGFILFTLFYSWKTTILFIKESFKQYFLFILFSVIGILIGTVEAVIAIPEIKYGLTSIACLCMTFFYIALIILNAICVKGNIGRTLKNEPK